MRGVRCGGEDRWLLGVLNTKTGKRATRPNVKNDGDVLRGGKETGGGGGGGGRRFRYFDRGPKKKRATRITGRGMEKGAGTKGCRGGKSQKMMRDWRTT